MIRRRQTLGTDERDIGSANSVGILLQNEAGFSSENFAEFVLADKSRKVKRDVLSNVPVLISRWTHHDQFPPDQFKATDIAHSL